MPPNNCHGSLTKIVATIGPTSEQLPVLQELVHAGMTVMRLNFSHATVEEVELRTTNLKACKVRGHKHTHGYHVCLIFLYPHMSKTDHYLRFLAFQSISF